MSLGVPHSQPARSKCLPRLAPTHYTPQRPRLTQPTNADDPSPQRTPQPKMRTSPLGAPVATLLSLRAHSHQRAPKAQSEPRRLGRPLCRPLGATCAVGSGKRASPRGDANTTSHTYSHKDLNATHAPYTQRLRETRSKPASIETPISLPDGIGARIGTAAGEAG